MTLTDFDKALLQLLQRSVPLVRRPFEQLARELGRSEPDVIARVGELSADGGVIREIAGIFDATLLGYRSMLAGMKVPPSHLDDAGKIVSAHPGVSHCYSRPAAYNLWFTLVCPPDSSLGLEGTAQRLAKLCEVQQVLLLPVLRRYKLRVNIPLGEGPAESLAEEPAEELETPRKPIQPTAQQIAAIKALQQPLPATPQPFDALAAEQNLDADELLVIAADLLAAGALRRYSAVLRHRSAGAVHNVLAAWQVSEEQADAFGRAAAEVPQISHCYLRPAGPEWPYTLYTMIHARDEAQARGVIAALAQFGHPHVELPTLKEFKKAKVRLFSEGFGQWEKANKA